MFLTVTCASQVHPSEAAGWFYQQSHSQWGRREGRASSGPRANEGRRPQLVAHPYFSSSPFDPVGAVSSPARSRCSFRGREEGMYSPNVCAGSVQVAGGDGDFSLSLS